MITTRRIYIEMIRRQIYGGQPSADAAITVGLVNRWLNFGIAAAAKQNYRDNIQIDGISYVNNSFYSTFKNISISYDDVFLWKVQLPQIPLGIGASEGISTLVLKDSSTAQTSYPVLLLSENQRSIARGMRPIPNKLLGYSEGEFVFVESAVLLNDYTATVTMISGGNGNDLGSTINIPDDYFPVVVEYVKQQLMFSLSVPVDRAADGEDVNKSA